MTYLAKLILLITLLCSFALSVFGQNTTPSPQTIPPARPGKIATFYDASKNTTNAFLSFTDVGGESACGLYIAARFSYVGKTAAPPSEVNLIMMRITPEEKIKTAPARSLTFTADGELIDLGLMETASQESNLGLRWETLQTAMPYKLFLKIASAKKVTAKLGSANFMLTENNLNFMREFANRTKP